MAYDFLECVLEWSITFWSVFWSEVGIFGVCFGVEYYFLECVLEWSRNFWSVFWSGVLLFGVCFGVE